MFKNRFFKHIRVYWKEILVYFSATAILTYLFVLMSDDGSSFFGINGFYRNIFFINTASSSSDSSNYSNNYFSNSLGNSSNNSSGNNPGNSSSAPSISNFGNNFSSNNQVSVPGHSPGCMMGCDTQVTTRFQAITNSPSGSNANLTSSIPLNSIPTDSQIAQSIAQQNQQAALLAALVAKQDALTQDVMTAAAATKYTTINSGDIPAADNTPAPDDIVQKIKTAQLIQH